MASIPATTLKIKSAIFDAVATSVSDIDTSIKQVQEERNKVEKHIDELEEDIEFFNGVLTDIARDTIQLRKDVDELITNVDTLNNKVEYLMEFTKKQELTINALESSVHILTQMVMKGDKQC